MSSNIYKEIEQNAVLNIIDELIDMRIQEFVVENFNEIDNQNEEKKENIINNQNLKSNKE